jgi:ABC-2 type transport system ATP-binding protein
VIEVSAITKSFNHTQVLENISFKLSKGKVLGILGPNGSGKTTLLKILALVMKPDHGSYSIQGDDVFKASNKFRSLIGYVPQDIALFDELSVMDNLIYWSRPGVNHGKDKYHQLLKIFEIDAYTRKKVFTLSGGMKRRLNLAVAMINSPQILIMDEPMVGVDILQLKHLQDHLRSLAETGITQIITSHNANAVINIIDQVLLIYEGKMRYFQDKSDFMALCDNNFGKLDDTILKLIYSQGDKK